jgi:hypothetical protein
MQNILYRWLPLGKQQASASAAAGQNDAKRNDKSHKNAIFNTITLRVPREREPAKKVCRREEKYFMKSAALVRRRRKKFGLG